MIFSRFYKQNEFSQGAGLGLSICQVIIEKLGGKIELKSEVGKGSRFTVILPCRVVS
jgi:signal transduction histidine kinase